MKAILTLIVVLFFGTMAMAQHTAADTMVETIEMGIALVDDVAHGTTLEITSSDTDNLEVALIYKFKNTRIKKELVFTTKNNKAKLA